MLTKTYVLLVKSSLYKIALIAIILSLFSCGAKRDVGSSNPDVKVESPAVDEVPPPDLDMMALPDERMEEPVGSIDYENRDYENENIKDVVTEEVVYDMDEPKILYSMEQPAEENSPSSSGWGTTSEPATVDNKDFKVALLVDSIMYEGKAGNMKVWIGEKDVEIQTSQGIVMDTKTIPGSIGRYAKITPVANDFEIKSAKEEDVSVLTTICHKIDPSGSEVRYLITPKEQGNYQVSADVELFKTKDCTGESVSKTAKTLTVKVVVNKDKVNALKADAKAEKDKKREEKLDGIEDVFWDKLTIFSTALLTIVFGAILFVIRRYIKSKTGFEDGPNIS